MVAIERDKSSLKGVLPKRYSRLRFRALLTEGSSRRVVLSRVWTEESGGRCCVDCAFGE